MNIVSASQADDLNTTDTLEAIDEIQYETDLEEETDIENDYEAQKAPPQDILALPDFEDRLGDEATNLEIIFNDFEYEFYTGEPLYYAGDNVTISFKVTPHPELGLVKADINGKPYNVAVINGTGNITIEKILSDDYTVNAKFIAGNGYLESSPSTGSFFVEKKILDAWAGYQPDPYVYDHIEEKVYGDEVIIYVRAELYRGGEFNASAIFNFQNKSYIVPINVSIEGMMHAVLNLGVLPSSEDDYEVTYTLVSNDDFYEFNCMGSPLQFHIYKKELYVSVDISDDYYNPDEFKVNDPITITMYVDEGVNCTGIVSIDGIDYFVEITDGYGDFTLNNLAIGEHSLEYSLHENNYVPSYTEDRTFTVIPRNAAIDWSIDDNTRYDEYEVEGDSAVITFDVYDSDQSTAINCTLVVYVDSTRYYVSVVNGKGILPLYDLDEKKYHITASILPVGDYTVQSWDEPSFDMTVTMPGASDDSEIYLAINYFPYDGTDDFNYVNDNTFNADFGSSLTLYVALLDQDDRKFEFDGACSINFNGSEYYIPITNGTGNFTAYNLVGGQFNINASLLNRQGIKYLDSENYKIKVDKVRRDVIYSFPYNTITSFVNLDQNLEIFVSVNEENNYLQDYYNGTVAIYFNNDCYNVYVENGFAKFNLKDFPAGEYAIRLFIPEDEKYVESEYYSSPDDGGGLIIYKYNATLSVYVGTKEGYTYSDEFNISADINPVIYIDFIVSFGYDVLEYINAIVDVNLSGTVYHVPVVAGKGNLTIDKLPVGSYLINASFKEDDMFNSNVSENIILNIEAVKLMINMTVNNNDYGLQEYSISTDHSSVNLKVGYGNDYNSFNGTVVVSVNGTEYNVAVVNGKGNLTLFNLNNGKYDLNASIANNKIYNLTVSNKTLIVSKAPAVDKNITGINITGVKDAEVGDEWTIHVETNSTENMTVRVNGKIIELDANGNFTAPADTSGTYIITVDIEEGEFWTKAFKNATYNVAKRNAVIENVNASELVTLGNNATVNVTLNVKSGKLLIEINGMNYTVDINDYNATLSLALPVGEYPVKVYYLGDDMYNDTKDLAAGTVNVVAKNATEIIIGVEKIVVVDTNVTITVTTNSTADLTVKVNGENATKVSDGVYNFTVGAVGVYTITAETVENEYYSVGFNSTAFTVVKHNSTVEIDPIDIHYVGEAFTITVGSNATVNVTINGKPYDVVGGTVDVSGLAAGEYNVVATVYESAKYNANITNATFSIIKYNASIASVVATSSVTVAQNTSIVVTMADDNVTAGKILIEVNGMNYTVDIVGKVARLNVTLPVGTYNVTAYFLGDDEYNPTNMTSSNFAVVDKNVTGINITGIKVVEVDDSLIIHVETNSTESMTVRINGKIAELDANGNFTADTSAAGTYIVTADVEEGEFWTKASENATFTVVKHNAVISSVNVTESVSIGDNAVVNVTMANVSGGKLLIEINGMNYTVDINDFNATLSLVLPVGEYPVKVYYLGDDKYNSTENLSAGVIKVADKYACKIVISVDKVWVVDDTVVFEVTTNSTADLTVKVNSQTPNDMGNGKYNITVDAVGVYTITAETDGNDYYHAGSNSTTFTVIKHNSTVEIDPIDIHYVGEAFTITVSSNATVNVTINGKPYDVVGGTVDVSGLAAGEYNVVATVYESAKYNANITNATFSIVKYNASIESVVVTPSVTVNQNTTIVVTMADDNVTNGKIIIEVNGMNYTVDIIDKVAKLNVTLPVGTYNATAYFMGDDKYNSDNKTSSNFAVVEKNVTGINITGIKVVEVDDVLVIHVETNSTENMLVRVNGKTADLDDNGNFTADTTAAGTYIVTVDVEEGEFWTKAFKNATYTVVKHNAVIESVNVTESVTLGDNAEINVTLNVESGKLLIEINNMNYTVDINGYNATLSLALPVGKYPVKVYYLGDDKYNSTENLSAGVINVADKYTTEIVITVDKVWVVDDAVVFEVTTNSTADLTVKVNSQAPNAMGNGMYNFTADSVGVYTITAETDENDYYHAGSNSTTFTVIKHNSTVEIAPINIHYVAESFTITLSSNTTVNVTINGKPYDLTDNGDGTYAVDVNGLAAGEYTVVATVYESAKYNANITNATFSIVKFNASIESVVATPSVTVGQNTSIVVTMADDNVTAGKILIEVNGMNYTVDIVDKVVKLNVALPVGTYNATAYFIGDDKYYPTNKTSSNFAVVEKNVTGIDITGIKVVEVDDTLIIHVETNSTESMTVRVNGKIAELDANGNFTADTAAAGTYIVIVDVEEGEFWSEASENATYAVVKHNAVIESVNVTESVTLGDNAEVNVTLNVESGKLLIEINNMNYTADINDYAAELSLALPVGKYPVKVYYLGDDKYNSTENLSAGTIDVVDKYACEIVISVDKVWVVDDTVVFVVTTNSTADLTVKVNSQDPNAMGNGMYNFTADAVGVYTITAETDENDYYCAGSQSETFTVIKHNSTVEIAQIETHYVYEAFTITVESNATVNVTINGKAYEVVDGKVTVSGLDAGEYTVNAIVFENDKYNGNAANATFKVIKYDSFVIVEADSITAGETAVIKVTAPDDTEAMVILYIGDINYEVDIVDGSGELKLNGMTLENYSITAVYLENDKYLSEINYTSFNVSKVDANASLDVEDSTVGEHAVITVTVPEDANGEVTVTVGNITKTVPVTGGENQIVIDGIPEGEHNVTAVYNGGDKYSPQTLNGTINVTPAKPDDPINHEVNVTIENVTSNSAVAVIEVADNMNGEVNITVDGKTFTQTVENGTAVVPLENLTPGKHDVSVIFEGDDNTVTTVQTTVDVPKEQTEANVTVDVDNGIVTITVDLPQDATGVVLVDIDGKGYYAPVEDGKAVLDVTDLAPGNHTVKATYPGDDKYDSVSDEESFTVPKASHEVNITADTNAVEVDVADGINGTVTVSVDGKNYTAPVVNGKAVVPIDNLTPGSHEIEVTVKGDDNTTSAAKTTVDVPKEEAAVNITVSADGGTVTVDVELPDDATGVVLVDIDGKGYYAPVEDGKAVLNVTDLAAGNHTVKATYPGDDKYDSAFDEESFTVPKTSHEVNITADANAVEVDVADDINGTVTVSVDGKNYTAPVVNGKAVVPVGNLTPGSHEIEATVKGDDNTTSSAKTTVDIPKADADISISANDAKNGLEIEIDLPNDATGVVLVDIGGKGYYANVTDGKAALNISDLEPGNYTVTANYLGDDKYNPSSVSGNFTVTKKAIETLIVVQRTFTRIANDWDAGERGAMFYGILMDTDENLLANKTVQIAVNGPIYNVTTDEYGRAGLQVNLARANTYTYALFFAGDEKYNASHIASTKLTVVKKTTSIAASAKSFKASAKTKTVSVTLKTCKNPYDGKTYLSPGKKITLTVDGKTYTANTNAKGVAKFNIKLTKKGTYTAKVSFAGDMSYSASGKNIKITIK